MDRSRSVVAWGREQGTAWREYKMAQDNLIVVIISQIVHLKLYTVNYTLYMYALWCQLHLNKALKKLIQFSTLSGLQKQGAPLLGMYPEKTIIQKDSCTTMFTAALFTIARTWKQPNCPSTDEWLKKMWHIYTMEY